MICFKNFSKLINKKLLILLFIPNSYGFNLEKLIISHLDIKLFRESVKIQISNNHKPLSYKKAKQILLRYDRMRIYDNNENDINFNTNNIEIKDYYTNNRNIEKNTNWNIEHLYPQSKGTKNIPLKSDLYHLFVCNSLLNSHRSNFKFSDSIDFNNDDKIDYLDRRGKKIDIINNNFYHNKAILSCKNNQKKIFIPTNYNKGLISRSIAYMSLRYNLSLDQIMDPPKLILDWNNKYPPTTDEIMRSLWIYRHQGNINLFILYPELINYCFSDILNINKNSINESETNLDLEFNSDYISNLQAKNIYLDLIHYFNIISKEEKDNCSI